MSNTSWLVNKTNYNIKHILRKHNIPAWLVHKRNSTLLQLTNKQVHHQGNACKSKTCPAPNHMPSLAHCLPSSMLTTRQSSDKQHSASMIVHLSMLQLPSVDTRSLPSASIILSSIQTVNVRCNTEALRGHLYLHIEEVLKIEELHPALNRKQENLAPASCLSVTFHARLTPYTRTGHLYSHLHLYCLSMQNIPAWQHKC